MNGSRPVAGRTGVRRDGCAFLLFALGLSVPAAGQQAPDAFDVVTGATTDDMVVIATPRDVATLDVVTSTWNLLHQLREDIPLGVNIDALTVFSCGDVVFSVDATATVGGIVAEDEDLVCFHSVAASYSLHFDASATALPQGAGLDAIHVLGLESDAGMLLSVGSTATVGTIDALPSSVLSYDGISFTIEADGRDLFGEEAARVNVDGMALLEDGSLLISTDMAVAVNGGAAGGEDLLRWDGAELTLFRDLSADGFPAAGVGTEAVDLQHAPTLSAATFEPGIVSTQGTVMVNVVAGDSDGDPIPQVDLQLNALLPIPMDQESGCGPPLCDGNPANGELFAAALSPLPSGATSTLVFTSSDGRDASSPLNAPGPSFVSHPGDGDGDGVMDAGDLARIVAELTDDNGSASIGDVRHGHVVDSWGGCDGDGDNELGADDLPAAVSAGY